MVLRDAQNFSYELQKDLSFFYIKLFLEREKNWRIQRHKDFGIYTKYSKQYKYRLMFT